MFVLLSLFIIWRLSLFLASWLGERFVPFTPSFPYSDVYLTPSGLPGWLWSFANFDGVHYLTIAKQGYSAQFTQVFFPLYPLLIKSIHNLLPIMNPIIIGLMISNICFFLVLIMFWKLLSLDYKADSIKWMILFLVFFPISFFFGSLYTESLFLFLILASFYAARKKRWWLAGILGGFASATRFVGIFLLPALFWEWYKNKFKVQPDQIGTKFKMILRHSERSEESYESKFNKKDPSTSLGMTFRATLHFTLYTLHSPILYLVPLGLVTYMAYLQLTFGDWLYFWHVQPVFGAERSGAGFILLPQVVWRYLKILLTVPLRNYNFWVALWELGSVVVGCGLWVVGLIKKVRVSYLIFSFLTIIIPTLTGTFSSMPRYVLVAFPIFIALGLIQNKLLKISLFIIHYSLFIIFTVFFTRGYWVA